MPLIAELRLHGDLILFETTFEAAPEAICTFADFHSVQKQTGETSYVFFWWVSGCDLDRFDSALHADDTVTGFKRIGTLSGRGLYRIETTSFDSSQPLVFPLFRDNDITAIETRRDAEGLHLQARFPTRRALDIFLKAAEQISKTTDLKRLYRETATDPTENTLTRRQREALVLAYERGYFAVPKQATLAELADELDITPQTLSRHIRVGVQRVIETAVNSIDNEPAHNEN